MQQIKDVIDTAGLPEDKRDGLMNKLNKFGEVDRNRTPLNVFGDLVIYLANVGGDAAKKLEPARKWVDSIAALLRHNKEIENSLPKLVKPQQRGIEDGRPKVSRLPKPGDMDDEIPF